MISTRMSSKVEQERADDHPGNPRNASGKTPMADRAAVSVDSRMTEVSGMAQQAHVDQARSAFAKAYEIYRELFECNPQPMWAYDAQTLAFLAVNDAAISRYGYSRDEFLAMTILDIRPEEDRERLRERTHADLGPLSVSGLWRHRWKDGTIRNVEISSHEFTFAERRARLVVAHDVTERLAALEDLKRSEAEAAGRARQQAVIASLGLEALEGTSLPVLLDRAVRQVAEVLGIEFCKVLELLPDRSAVLLRAGVGWQEGLIGTATADIGPQSQAGYTLQSKDPVIVEDLRTETRFSGPPLLVEHGVVSGMSVIIGDVAAPYGVLGAHAASRRAFSVHDVHFLQGVANLLADAVERHRSQEALLESEERFRALFENSLDAVMLTVPDGRVLAANPEACRIFGRSEAEIVRVGRAGLVDVSDPRLAELTAERQRTGRARGVLTFFRGDGTTFQGAMSSGVFLTRRGERQSSMTVHDLTERREAEAKVAEQLAELRRWHDATLGREARILELKREVNVLLGELGRPVRYASVDAAEAISVWHSGEADAAPQG
jgi:PAS domain S-box-containing protein